MAAKRSRPFIFMFKCQLLTRSDGAHRAGIGAGTAVDADFRIDRINVTFLDGALRALGLASTASYAGVWRNFICHNVMRLLISYFFLTHKSNIFIVTLQRYEKSFSDIGHAVALQSGFRPDCPRLRHRGPQGRPSDLHVHLYQ